MIHLSALGRAAAGRVHTSKPVAEADRLETVAGVVR